MEFDARQMMIDLDTFLTQRHAEYIELHKEFDTFRGKQITQEEEKDLNEVLRKIQDMFERDFHPIFNFIGLRYQFSVNAVTSYTHFIKELEEAGFTRVEPQPTHKAIIHGMSDVQN